MNNSSFVYNYISESNNAKISYCTSQADRCSSTNILNNKIKVRKFIFIKIYIFTNIEYLALIFKYSTRNNNRYF